MDEEKHKKNNWKTILQGDRLNQAKELLIGKVLLTAFAFSMNYAIVEQEAGEKHYEKIYSFIPRISDFLNSIDAQPLRTLILLWFLLKFYRICDHSKRSGRNRIGAAILALTASISLLTGNAIYKYDLLEMMFLGGMQCVKSFIIVSGYFLFFQKLFTIVTDVYENYLNNKKDCLIIRFFDRKYVGMIIFISLLIVWGGALFVYYPAIFMGDTEDILYMAFNYPTGLINSVVLPKEGVYLLNHHPVVYTLFVRAIMEIVRRLGGGDKSSIFVCAMLQCIISAVILAYSCIYCAKQLKKPGIAMIALLFWVVCPWISKYTIMISKDTFFAAFVLLFGIKLHQLLNTADETKYNFGVLLSALMVLLFRKNGFYIIVLTFVSLLFLYKKHWKKWFCYIMIVILFYISYSNIILPVMGIADGSAREALSVPFQQTARYVQKHGDEITVQERNAIDAVLQYDVLAEVYSPNISDPVKSTFRIDAKNEDLMSYFKVWFFMFWKHPETYAAATLNNYYGYFYPVVNDVQKLYNTSVGSMDNANRDGYFEFENIYDEVHVWLRDLCALYDMAWMKLPVINIFITSAFYVWVVLYGCLIKWGRGDKTGLAFMIVYGMTTLTALAGPCNAINYERYIYPLILGFPIIIGVLLYENRKV